MARIKKIPGLRGDNVIQKGDKAHLEAMNRMKHLMQSPDHMKEWFENKKKEFDGLSED